MQDLLEWVPLLLGGLVQTVLLFATVLILGSSLAIVIGLARLSRFRSARYLASVYVEFFRGISLYVTLFWLYFAFPFIGMRLTVWEASVIGCALTHAAYSSEYIRSAVLSIPGSQHEAAVALGMNTFQRIRYVVLPQALVALLPLMGNEFVMLLKGTSIVSLIGLAELTEQAHSIIVSTYQPVPVLVVVLCIYFAGAQLIIRVMGLMEIRFGRWKRRTVASPVR
ncbi:amino acid ABC transporter permease [Phyllobacterium sophorae]|uniref:Amino acid ABC transporter permease n=1 Tax=Phyllobacterium sophorae TaxID=1520277 RepID=A0A2P7B6V0_9HYPH|nr:amino acid ABC transporter permease [Phyllobacterium sophorae]PSH62193.1 amino acid ABC transporter permease [Phyllobacterium sophorae]